MHWTLRGAHLLLQTRTKVLNNELEEVFCRLYPQFHAQAAWPRLPDALDSGRLGHAQLAARIPYGVDFREVRCL
jgi:hypothetical protein